MAKFVVKTSNTNSLRFKQSKFSELPELPTRSIIIGPSGSGKSLLLQNLITNGYAGLFERIYIFSPSIDIDSTWQPVKNYIKNNIKLAKDEQVYFNSYNVADLENIINKQYKVVEYLKSNNYEFAMQILIIIDDFADNPKLTHDSNILNSLYTRGRHLNISILISSQGFKKISPLIRKNITHLMLFRIRNQADLDAIIDELSALYNKKTLLKIYETATKEKYHFLYINLVEMDKENIFFINFDKKIIVNNI